jgi:hypothetical protein
MHDEDLHNVCYSPSIIRVIKSRRIKWDGQKARIGERKGLYKIVIGKTKGTRSLGRPKRRLEDNIRTDSKINMGG